MRGIPAPVAVSLSAVFVDGRHVTAHGTTTIDRYAFGMPRAKSMTGRYLKNALDVSAHCWDHRLLGRATQRSADIQNR